MLARQYLVSDEPAMEKLAADFASCLSMPLLMTFSGAIGAGKTCFIRAMLRALGITGAIKSPTFSLVESYQSEHLHIHHFDLYRIQEELELDYLGFRDFFNEHSICCIEWPERSSFCLQKADIQCAFTIEGMGRIIDFHALTTRGEKVLSCVATQ